MSGEGKVCDRCGAALRPTLRFCTECGQIVAPVTTYADLTRPIDPAAALAPTVAMRPPPASTTVSNGTPALTTGTPTFTTISTPAPVATPKTERGWRTVAGGLAVFLGLIALLVAAAIVGVAFRDSSEPLPFISATLARDSSPEFKPIDPTTTFDPIDDAFHLTFIVIGAAPEDVLKTVWVAADVGDAAPRNTVIDEATITLDKRDESGSFRLQRGAKPWPPGDYQVKLYVNNRLAQTIPFTVAP